MDGGLNDGPSSETGLVGGNAASPLSLREIFTKACPVYMSYGMTYDEFWNGDTASHRMYREANKMKIRSANMQAWVQGRYVYDAIGAMVPVLRAFSKARKPSEYPDHPYDLFAEDRIERELAEQKERYERIREKVSAFAAEYNKQRQEKLNSEGKEVEENG